MRRFIRKRRELSLQEQFDNERRKFIEYVEELQRALDEFHQKSTEPTQTYVEDLVEVHPGEEGYETASVIDCIAGECQEIILSMPKSPWTDLLKGGTYPKGMADTLSVIK